MIFAVPLIAALIGGVPQAERVIGPLAERLGRIEAYIEQQRSEQHVPGLSVAIVHDGKAVWSRGFGAADVENDVPATADTVYRIASISRMLTAVGVLQLVQQSKISLRADVRDYVPELPDKGSRITLEHLLPHLSGIRPYKSREELFNKNSYRRLIDTLDVFKDDPLVTKPGERFLNTPFGYVLLGVVIERVSGMSYGAYLDKHVLDVVGMKASGVEDLSAIVPRRARGYILRKDLTLRNSAFVDLSARTPADGLVSTANDLARFVAGYIDGKLLAPEFVKVMTTEHQTSGGQATQYGMGCFVRTESGRRIIGHGGWQPQVSTFLVIAPDQRAAVVVLANLEQADVKTIALTTLDMLLSE